MKKENKIIQGLWIGKSLSLMEQLSIKSFLANGHEYHLYVYDKVKNIPKGTLIRDGKEILPKHKIFKHRKGEGRGSYAGFSELFRLKLLLDKGGIWTDLDTICLKPFDFKKKYVFSSENTFDRKTKVNVGVIKVPIKDPLIRSCYEEAKKRDPKTVRFAEMGPELMNSKVNEFKLNSFVLPPNAFCPIDHRNFKKLIDPNFNFRIPKETYAIHLWNEKWRREIRDESIWNFKKKMIYLKKFFYKTSAKINSKVYSKLILLVKKDVPLLSDIPLIDKKKPSNLTERFDKNKIYDANTLYGKLQRMYLSS